jgi:hypothetical protein
MGATRIGPGHPRQRRASAATLVCVAAGLGLSGLAHAEAPPLIPAPFSVSIAGERRALADTLQVSSETPREDAYAIQRLRELAARPRAGGGPRLAIARIRLVAGRLEGLPPGRVPEQGYAIECRGDSVLIRGETAAARLYGAMTLRQLALTGDGRLPAGRIVDAPALRVRGLSLDVSRGRMPTLDDLRATLDLCTAFKLNVLQLYLEDTFEYSRVPADARSPWALDALTLRRLAAEARRRSIDLIPIVETMGHQERMLSHPAMRTYAELDPPSPSAMFAVTEPRARALLGSMVDDVLAASGAGAIHLGCDEPAELGRGASRGAVRRLGVAQVFAEHVRALADRAGSRHGGRAWIYADMVRVLPALARLLPRDVVLVDWDYDPASTYASLDTLAAAGLDRVITSPGLWTWSTPYPEYARAHASIEAATSAARARGCLGSVLAAWGDGGGEDLAGNDVLGIAYFAEHAWSREPGAFDTFLARYARLRFQPGEMGDAFRSLAGLSLPNGAHLGQLVEHPVLVRPRTDAWLARVRELEPRLDRAGAALAGAMARDVQGEAELEAMQSAVARLLAAVHRERTLDSIATRLSTPGVAGDPAFRAWSSAALARLHDEGSRSMAEYATAWRARNRESGLPVLLARSAAQLATLDSLRSCAERGTLEIARPAAALAGVVDR